MDKDTLIFSIALFNTFLGVNNSDLNEMSKNKQEEIIKKLDYIINRLDNIERG